MDGPLLHIQQGRVQRNPNPVYARINARVNTVVNDYANRGHLDYLDWLQHNCVTVILIVRHYLILKTVICIIVYIYNLTNCL